MVTEIRVSPRSPTRAGAMKASAQYRVAAVGKLPSADDGVASSSGGSPASSVGRASWISSVSETVSSEEGSSSSTVSSGTSFSTVSSTAISTASSMRASSASSFASDASFSVVTAGSSASASGSPSRGRSTSGARPDTCASRVSSAWYRRFLPAPSGALASATPSPTPPEASAASAPTASMAASATARLARDHDDETVSVVSRHTWGSVVPTRPASASVRGVSSPTPVISARLVDPGSMSAGQPLTHLARSVLATRRARKQ